jgi:hypothetical protein
MNKRRFTMMGICCIPWLGFPGTDKNILYTEMIALREAWFA